MSALPQPERHTPEHRVHVNAGPAAPDGALRDPRPQEATIEIEEAARDFLHAVEVHGIENRDPSPLYLAGQRLRTALERPRGQAPPQSDQATSPPAEDDRPVALVDDQVAEKGEQLALFDADEYLGPLRYVPCHKARDEDHDRARCWLCFGDRHL